VSDPVYQRLVTLIDQMRFREYEFRNSFPGVPCQCETAWHADEIKEWADELSAFASPPPDEPPHRSARRALDRLIEEPKDSSTIHYDEDTIPHGACSDPIHCDCMCPHCWLEKVEIIEAAILPAPPDDPEAHPRVHREPPSPERWKNRSRTMAGIAEAMAVQWGCCEPVAVDAADRSLEQPELSLREERIS
jgi:hypothetical protein